MSGNVHDLFSSHRREPNDSGDDDDDSEKNHEDDRFVGGIDARGGGSGLAVQPNPMMGNGAEAIFGRAERDGGGGASSNDNETRRTITMYRSGFVVDDGPYRRLDDPANADFLRSLASGRTPQEFLGEGNENVVVNLRDKRSEEYQETFQSFSGQGNSLGGTTSQASTSTSGSSSSGVFTADTTTSYQVDEARPTTRLQVRLLSGNKKVVTINTNATVAQLAFLLVEDSQGQAFSLVSGFPPKPLTKGTIEENGLKGAQVVMKKA